MTQTPITGPLPDTNEKTTAAALQDSLVDLLGLALIAKQAHWNVIGHNFRSVHLQLDELVALARTHADEVAERAATIGRSPDGRPATVAEQTGVPEYPEGWQKDVQVTKAVVDSLSALIARFRERIRQTEESDPVTQDLLITIASGLEKAHWMWQAQLA
ncbi:MAG: Dps family protein [Pseudonocardiaceae bacterium]